MGENGGGLRPGLLLLGTLNFDVLSAIGGTTILEFRNINIGQTVVDYGSMNLDEPLQGTVLMTFVPEPSVVVLLGISLAGLAVARRREA